MVDYEDFFDYSDEPRESFSNIDRIFVPMMVPSFVKDKISI